MNPRRRQIREMARAEVRSMVIRGVNWLGDAVMTTPALARIREHFPHCSITLLCPEKLAELWWRHPAVDEVLMVSPSETAFTVARQLRARRFDLGLVLPNSFRSAWELWLSRTPHRVGYAGNGRSWLLTQAVPRRSTEIRMVKRSARAVVAGNLPPRQKTNPPREAHHIHQYLHLAAALGASPAPRPPSLQVSDVEVLQFRERFLSPAHVEWRISPRIIGINPGAEYGPAKRWPAERFVAVAAEMIGPRPCVWVVFGGLRDESIVAPLCDGIRKAIQSSSRPGWVINVAGKTSLRELMAGLRLCDALLTNDTGPMHVAAALDTPVVVPFGSTSAALTGPGMPGDPRHRLLQSPHPPNCSPCFLRECPIDFRCMTEISVTEVASALHEVTTRSEPKSLR